MANINLQNFGGTWAVVTPCQTYEFPSYELAQSFYESLIENLK